jgi:hypothetical protein
LVFSAAGKIFIRDFVEELKMHDIEIDDEELGKGSRLFSSLENSVKRDLWTVKNGLS